MEYRYGTMSSGSQPHADGLLSSIGFQALTYDKGHQLSYEREVPGGLSNRSWRFSPPRLDPSGSFTFVPQVSGPVRVCIDTAIGTDCQESRLNVLLPGDLLITELMLDPHNPAQQWFEVRNVSGGVVDLNGLHIEIGGAGHTIQNGGPLLVQPGEYAVLARAHFNGIPADVPTYVYGSSLVMPAQAGSIVLSREGMAVAKESWQDNFGPKGASLELLPNRQRPGWVEGAGGIHFRPTTTSFDGPSLGTVDPSSDPARCGACGVACDEGQQCSEGSCVDLCPEGERLCAGGSCACAPGFERCGDRCVDLQRDPSHCGACEAACSELQHCAAGAVRLALGENHSCALLGSGQVKCWGQNSYSELGNNENGVHRHLPTLVPGLGGVVQLSSVDRTNCAVLDDRTAKCWGYAGSGQIGHGAAPPRADVPTQVMDPADPTKPFLGIDNLAVTWFSACAPKGSELYCWGSNSDGAVGDGTYTQRELPTLVQW